MSESFTLVGNDYLDLTGLPWSGRDPWSLRVVHPYTGAPKPPVTGTELVIGNDDTCTGTVGDV